MFLLCKSINVYTRLVGFFMTCLVGLGNLGLGFVQVATTKLKFNSGRRLHWLFLRFLVFLRLHPYLSDDFITVLQDELTFLLTYIWITFLRLRPLKFP